VINGHDAAVGALRTGSGAVEAARAAYWRWRGNLGGAIRRIVTHHREVRLPPAALPVALAVATAYYSLQCAAELATRATPRLVRRLWAL
jgi:hypothetical protein